MLKEPENWCLQGMPQADHHQNIIYTCKSVSQSQESIMCFQGSFKKNQNKATCTEATSNRQNLSDFRPQSFPPGPRSVSIAGQQGPLFALCQLLGLPHSTVAGFPEQVSTEDQIEAQGTL